MEGVLGGGSWLYIIFIGFIIGLLARFLKPGNDGMGIILTILLGIAGAMLASYIGRRMGWYAPGQAAGFIGAVIGAIVILMVMSLFRGRNRGGFRQR